MSLINSLESFVATKKILTDREAIDKFLDECGGGAGSADSYPAVMTYDDSFFIYQQTDGTYFCEIENTGLEGTLEQCEAYLWAYAACNYED
jgi:hypothetical protein